MNSVRGQAFKNSRFDIELIATILGSCPTIKHSHFDLPKHRVRALVFKSTGVP